MSSALPSSSRLHLRLFALAAILLAFDVVFVGVLYVLAHVALGLAPLVMYQYESLFWTMSFDIVPLWAALLVGTPLVLLVQSVFGYRLTLHDVRRGEVGPDKSLKNILLADRGGSEAEEPPEPTAVAAPSLRQRVARLAQTADIEAPELQVVDSETPNSYVASRPGERTLFVTTGLLEALSDDELDAVIAHELAHIKNGDAFVMTAAAFLPAVTERFNEGMAHALQHSMFGRFVFGKPDDDDDNSASYGGQFDMILLAFAALAMPMVAVLHVASTACYRLLSRIREYAADSGGVAINGSPAALADALETLTVDYRPETDLRTAETGVRELCVLPYAIEQSPTDGEAATDEENTSVAGRVAARWDDVSARVLPGSHPTPEARIAALREKQAEIES